MRAEYFFEIGIYRCSPDKYYKELKEGKDKFLEPLKKIKSISPDSYQNAGTFYDLNHWPMWNYNEVIGWLKLYRLGSQIRGELWFINSRRIRRGARKKFSNLGKIFEISFIESQSESEIREEVSSAIQRAAEKPPIKGRYLDRQCFDLVYTQLCWKNILGLKE
ncbi:MAG: hypothetical protein HRU77_01055 [Gammaproteobacteria bacterium]|nr:MAG: hypothetical protein HRU77_01055 [Gammaproteobacteria bacterium]